MDEDTGYNKVGDVVGCHVEDAVTFWAQNISRNNDILKLSRALAEVCPQANSVFGNPDFTKIYGGCFSEDKCWYRCKIQQVISDEKCQVLYIDYGNSEILNRSEIVEIPKNLQFPSIAKKYRLWGLQIPPDQDLNQFDQGRKFLCSLIFEKEIKMRHKATYQDGTIVAQAEYGKVDIGEEVAKKGFAEKCKSSINANNCEEKKIDVAQYKPWNAKVSAPAWENRPNPSISNRLKGRSGDQIGTNMRNENHTGNHIPFAKEKLMACDFIMGSNISLAKIKQDQKLIEENEKLKKEREILQEENHILLHNYKELESTIAQLNHQVQEEKEASKETLKYLGETLHTYIGTKLRSLAAQVEVLKEVRRTNVNVHFGDDLFRAVKEVTERCLIAPSSLGKLEKIWAEYNLAQEMIQLCKNVNESDVLILKRNEVQQNLYSAVEEFILEVDELPLSERSTILEELSASLEAVYGQASEADDSEEAFQQFFEWKQTKLEEFSRVRSGTNASLQILATWFSDMIKFFDLVSEVSLKSEEVVGNVDEVLEKVESDICKELEISLVAQDEADKEIILNAYNKVIWKIRQEQHLITVVQSKYSTSVEFKKQIAEWLNKSPNIDNLFSIKKTLKNVKARLRWKLVEKSNLEESDDYSEYEITKIKEEITGLRNSLIQEIYKEQEEYERLTCLVQKWFPELPLLHPEAGILKYMNSGGLLTVSLERDLLDAEPLKKLSTKHPLVCSEVQEQKVLLKGYSVDVNTEAKVIERTAKYHRAWSEFKEKSGLLQLMFLFLCKSDPLVYLMVPYYPGASLGTLQASTPLTSEEILKVMEGVARGLHTLHKANIVHGSLHTNNVFALNRKQGIVGDFDFTKSVDQRASANSMVVGNLNLISPELRMGHLASPSSDMYAYGCLLFWLFAGDQEFKMKENGTPEVDGLNMDNKVKSLLLNLICSNRMTAEQVLNDNCFLFPDVIPAPPQNEPGEELECEKTEEKGEDIISSDNKTDDNEEIDPSQ
ncbi:serine/threonine-protein kinase 31 isoform X2 [Dermochelys coriacea]|uniref:serine/threonine-protein kinase 31 isoform X2 n=1 Tax=Dermochelys coriacea TaxID=27794 RepID=UPI0018E802A7|nr:serine/threonine-protein kinase 31 isoform X2 [Dermochelys coriacea]XP_043365105.1 serine/threonine-protein kinase 31 isoform X2 [Dermochelys coriacea]